MKSRLRYIIPIIYIFSDIAGILISFYLAYQIRFFSITVRIMPITKGIPPLSVYIQATLYVALVWAFIFGLMGHYKKRSPSSFDRFWEVVRGVTAGAVLIIASTFFYRGESFSRLVMGYAWAASIIILFLFRQFIYRYELAMFRRGDIVKRTIIVGDEPAGLKLYGKLKTQPAWGINPIGFVTNENPDIVGQQKDLFEANNLSNNSNCGIAIDLEGPRDLQNAGRLWLGSIQDLENIINENHINLIIFNLPPEQGYIIENFVMGSENLGLEYMLTPDTLAIITSNAATLQVEGIPLICWGKTPLEGYHRVIKRGFDLLLSAFGLMVSSIPLLVLWPMIKIDSPGPIFYRQKRLGRDGRIFTIFKLRTMAHDPDDKPGWTVKNDPRLTRIGKHLRRWNIDELPQLYNVLTGRMSIVGPRPEQPAYVEKFRNGIPRYFHRHRVKSGMTGWAQVNGLRGDTSIDERTRYDLYYVENWSLVFDLKIILLTVRNMFRNSETMADQ
jgi:Undecaprenyl-phosphate glucose phosphotransferase